jgi:hypothetical protein
MRTRKPRADWLRSRLERALAREDRLFLTLPAAIRERLPEREAWLGIGNDEWVDERGEPYPKCVVALEAYVTALSKASEGERNAIAALLSQKSHEAETAFLRLVRDGANAVWIAEDCLLLRPHRSDRPRNRNPTRRTYVKNALQRLSRRLERLSADYKAALGYVDEIGIFGMGRHRETPRVLLQESRFIDSIVMRMSKRRPSDIYREYINLAEHLRMTTGTYHDADVCKLFDAVRPRAGGKRWTAGTLEQYRVRDKKGEGRLGENIWSEIVSEQIERATKQHPKR